LGFSGVDARWLPPPRLAMEVPRAGDVLGVVILDDGIVSALSLPASWLDDPVPSALSPDRPGFSLPVGTVTFLLTDIAGSTRGWELAPEAMGGAVGRHYELLDQAIRAHHGVRPVEQGEGDSVVGAFARASDAVGAALDAQRALVSEAWPAAAQLRVRMAVHTGEAELRGEGNYFGPAVIRCARLRAIAHGGQVLVSQPTADLVVGRLPEGASLADLGSHRLKDLGRPEQVFELRHRDLSGRFGPLRSLDALPHNLPVQLTTFVGRRKELEEAAGLLASTRLLSLTGVGGCGKTRLALQLAAEVAEHYPGGVWLVELAPVADPGRVAASIAAALGERDAGAETVEAIVARLDADAALLVLDNCEHLLDAVAALADVLLRRCPRLVIVATSREPLGVPGETGWRVPSLSLPGRFEPVEPEALSQFDAVRLFLDRAAKARPNFVLGVDNAPFVAQVCARLDGIPLAIELAAARVRGMTVEQVAAGLDDRFRLLTGGARTVLPRQQTLQASVDWGYALLGDAERVVFRRLSVFAGGFSLDAAERVAAADSVEPVEVLDLLLALVDKSMVISDYTGRYRLLETLRQYGAARLLDAGETPAVRDRHLAWAAALRDPIEDALRFLRIEAAPDVEVEVDNLRAGFEWAVLRHSPDDALWIAATLVYWEATTGDTAEAVTLATRALRIDGGDRGLRLLVTSALLSACVERGDFDGLRPIVDAMVDEFGDLDDERVRCLCLYRAGFLHSWMRNYTKAIECYREAGELAERLHQHEMARGADVGAAIVQALRGDWRQAELTIPPLDDTDPMVSIAALNTNLVHTLVGLETGRFDEARRRADHLLGLAGRHNRLAATAQTRRAEIDLATGGDSGAHDALRGLLHESRRRRSTLTLRMSGWAPGAWALRNGDIVTAVAELKAWRSEGGIWTTQPAVLAQALLAAGDSDEARADLALYRATFDLGPLGDARVGHAEGLVSRAEGDIAAAEARHYAVLADAHDRGWRPLVAHSLEALAGTAAAHQSFAECARLAGAAQTLRDEMGYVLRWPFEQRLLDADLGAARAGLGEDAFTAAYTEGRRLDEDAAVGYSTRARGERRRPTHGWDSLTATETDVARLAATGLTNKQIAERLLIGAETVKTHIARVYDKLDVHTRVGLATAVTAMTTPPASPSP
jgi:predicted ATPase/class 3 adenylate cyclase/DNA-binding CsgD family transcriptional regulator